MEDDFNCSGMCSPSLFYFTRPLEEGPPQKTCLFSMKNALTNSSRSFAYTSVLTGVTALFLFFMHFSLYCRPVGPGDGNGMLSGPTMAQAMQDSTRSDSVDPGQVELQMPRH